MAPTISQIALFSEDRPATLPGLTYLPGYIDAATETALIKQIDQQPWLTDLKRRVQHYKNNLYG